MASLNLRNVADADKYSQEALRHLNAMTERERSLDARRSFSALAATMQGCAKEYGELIARYKADIVGLEPACAVLDSTAQLQAGHRRDAGRGRDGAESSGLPRQPRALLELRQ